MNYYKELNVRQYTAPDEEQSMKHQEKGLLTYQISPSLTKIINYLNTQYELSKFTFNNIKIYPPKNKVFNCFNCDFDKLKVVFIGKKPFDEYSEGLAFDSTDDKVNLHPISELIRYTIENEFYKGFNLGHDHTLKYLCDQGVLLLNESLTSCNRIDHSKIWEPFIIDVLKLIQSRHTGIIFCFQEDSEFIKLINQKLHYVLTYKDPEKYIKDFNNWGFKFSDINGILTYTNGEDYNIKF